MHAENLHKQMRKPRILISPLDWGLGHATRCIPIIRELLRLDFDVWLACDGNTNRLLADEFPQLTILEIPGYNIKYSRSGTGLFWGMLKQLPKLLNMIRYENHWLKTKIPVYDFDAIISDNRFGFYSKKTFSIFITHQLEIKSGLGKLADIILRSFHYRYINKFDQCWVPDIENKNSLAGELSHPEKMPKTQVQYIGMLSRFKSQSIPEIKKHILIVLSGPEPQRTILEKIILKDILSYPYTATVVRGLPGEVNSIPSKENIKFFNYLNAEGLNREMGKAEFVISRSGYSTIMDLARLQKKSILIPTPGQTEQLYLAKNLSTKNLALCIDQNDFSLIDAIAKAETFSYQPLQQYDDALLKQAVKSLVKN
ncbi:MAG: glycosyl transferase family 28 [Bacteroidetes bacterium]|nr:MAG: glycosyl transferase family 28 [Bacteroidota bacterium]